MCNGTPFTVEKVSPRAELESETARSVGKPLSYRSSYFQTEILVKTISRTIILVIFVLGKADIVHFGCKLRADFFYHCDYEKSSGSPILMVILIFVARKVTRSNAITLSSNQPAYLCKRIMAESSFSTEMVNNVKTIR